MVINGREKNLNVLIYLPLIAYFIIFAWPFFDMNKFNDSPLYVISLSLLLGRFMGGIVFFLIIFEFVFVSLGIYWLTRLITKKKIPLDIFERRIVALLISLGYLSWAIPIVIYSVTCTEKFCGLVIIAPLSLTAFLSNLFTGINKSDSMAMFMFLTGVNACLIYIFAGKGAGSIIMKLLKHEKTGLNINIKSYEERQ
jgi:multisubunit Na+/H+ antiporter MnhC subunit